LGWYYVCNYTATDAVTNPVTGIPDPVTGIPKNSLNQPNGIDVWTSLDKLTTKVCVASPKELGVATPAGTQQSITIYETAKNPIYVPGIGNPCGVAFSPNGNKVYVTSQAPQPSISGYTSGYYNIYEIDTTTIDPTTNSYKVTSFPLTKESGVQFPAQDQKLFP
jgi:DNA-binding beta-propeller fold protein YncE